MFSNANFTKEDWDEEALQKQVTDSQNYAQEEAARIQAFEGQAQQEGQQYDTNAANIKPDGSTKSSFDTKDPKQFGAKENVQEAQNAVVGGLQDVANSVAALPQKIFDPRFYTTSEGPYKPAWLPFNQEEQPINKTIWGNFIRSAVEMGGLMFLTRKAAAGGAKIAGQGNAVGKGLGFVAKGPQIVKGEKLSNVGRVIVHGAITGAPADLISNRSTESNMAADLIKIRPDWEEALKPFATHENMSPAQRSLYNMFEGLGIGPVVDLASEGVKSFVKGSLTRLGRKGGVAEAKAPVPHPNDARYAQLRKSAEQSLDFKVTAGAARTAEKAYAKDPVNKKLWRDMTADEQLTAKKEFAKKAGLNWGDDTHPAIKRQEAQDQNEIETGIQRLAADPEGEKGFDPYINTGGDVHQGRANSTTTSIVDTLESVHHMSTKWSDIDGTPNNFITKNELERINNTPGAVPITQEDYMKRVDRDPIFKQTIEELRAKRTPIDELAPQVFREFDEVLAGRKTIASMSDDEFEKLFTRNYDEYGKYAGMEYYSDVDHLKAAVLTGTLNREIRDIAQMQRSVMDNMDVTVKDGPLDQLLDRYTALGIGLKQSRYLRSAALDNLKYLNGEIKVKPPTKVEMATRIAEIADNQRSVRNLIREAIDNDTSDELLKLITDAFSANDKLSTWADIDTFFANKLSGYKEGNVTHKSAIQQELASLIVHSTISGPKTPVRAALGTGIVTFTRPVATALGAMLRGDERAVRGAYASMNGMFEGLGESWALFRHQLKANFSGNELPDLNTIATHYNQTQSDLDWEAMGNWVMTRGTDAQQATFGIANTMRWMNRNPILTWSSKVMAATDMVFHNLIGRARLKEIAYHKAYDSLVDAGRTVDDASMSTMVRQYEAALFDEVFDDRGMLRDEMAKYAASEAAMTKDIPALIAGIERAFDANWYTKPFMLFTRTAYNALELTGQHTPFINRFITEVDQIKNLPTGHPELLKYGIQTIDDHEAAKALIKGREAIGASVVGLAASLYMSGRLTGNGPSEKELNDTWKQLQWQPRSILIGDKYVSYDSLEPFNSFLAFVADVGDVQKEMGGTFVEKMLGRAWYLLQANITNKSFLFGLSQFSDLLGARDADKLGTIAGNMVNSYVPLSSLRNEIGKTFNPGMRELESGFRDAIKNRNLWVGEIADLPYKYDVLNGEPLKIYDWPTRAWNALMPFQINLGPTPTRQLLWRSLHDTKITVNTFPDGGEVPSQLKSKWQMLIGKQNVEAQLTKLFTDKKTGPQIMASIEVMERDRDGGDQKDPKTYLHNVQIEKIWKEAKRRAWVQLKQEPETSAILQRQAAANVIAEMRKRGRYTDAEQAEALYNLPYGK